MSIPRRLPSSLSRPPTATIRGVSASGPFTLSPDSTAIVRPGVLWWRNATVTEHLAALDTLLAQAEAALRAKPPADTAMVRAMYKRVGLDPTKTRPSSEALLRRILKGGAIPRINTMVDVINWCSVEFQLPYGLYDSRSSAVSRPCASVARARNTPAFAKTRYTSPGESPWPTTKGHSGIRRPTRPAPWSRPRRRTRWWSSTRPPHLRDRSSSVSCR